jgi:hypothetical protein
MTLNKLQTTSKSVIPPEPVSSPSIFESKLYDIFGRPYLVECRSGEMDTPGPCVIGRNAMIMEETYDEVTRTMSMLDPMLYYIIVIVVVYSRRFFYNLLYCPCITCF